MFTQVQWPAVMNEPIEDAYFPDAPLDHRRMRAIADGLMCWGNSHLAKAPPQFGEVLQKLAKIAGIVSGSDAAFMVAAKAIEPCPPPPSPSPSPALSACPTAT